MREGIAGVQEGEEGGWHFGGLLVAELVGGLESESERVADRHVGSLNRIISRLDKAEGKVGTWVSIVSLLIATTRCETKNLAIQQDLSPNQIC